DYLTKPFSPRELLARLRAVLRRRRLEVQQGRPEGIRAYRFDGWELNLNTRRLRNREGQVVPLSNGEFSLLVVLLGHPIACSRAINSSTCPACTTMTSTTDRSTHRSCACGASWRPIRRTRAISL